MAAQNIQPRLTWTSIRSNTKFQNAVRMTLIYITLTLLAVIILMPIVWMISTSLKERTQIFSWPIEWIPDPVVFENYHNAITVRPFFLWMRNSFIVTMLSVIGHCLSATLVGYAFARLRWRGRNIVFLVTLATLMLPAEMIVLPQYILFQRLGWVDTFLPLFLPAFFGGAFNIFIMRQFMITLPKELDEAARLDGCTYFGVLWRVIVPQVLPAIGFIAINTFRARWNDFFRPLIYLNDPDLYTLALGLRTYRDEYTVEWAMLMAASVLALMPVIILFFVAQRYFIQGITFSGVKG